MPPTTELAYIFILDLIDFYATLGEFTAIPAMGDYYYLLRSPDPTPPHTCASIFLRLLLLYHLTKPGDSLIK